MRGEKPRSIAWRVCHGKLSEARMTRQNLGYPPALALMKTHECLAVLDTLESVLLFLQERSEFLTNTEDRQCRHIEPAGYRACHYFLALAQLLHQRIQMWMLDIQGDQRKKNPVLVGSLQATTSSTPESSNLLSLRRTVAELTPNSLASTVLVCRAFCSRSCMIRSSSGELFLIAQSYARSVHLVMMGPKGIDFCTTIPDNCWRLAR